MNNIEWPNLEAAKSLRGIDYASLEEACKRLTTASMSAAEAMQSFDTAARTVLPYSEWRTVSKRRARKLKKRGEYINYDEDGYHWLMAKDLHRLRASEMFGVGYPDVTNAQRQAAKSAYFFDNYAAAYGKLPTSRASRGPTFQEARERNAR